LSSQGGKISGTGIAAHTGKFADTSQEGATVNPEELICPNIDCPAKGQTGNKEYYRPW
jgi:hypothetical protein